MPRNMENAQEGLISGGLSKHIHFVTSVITKQLESLKCRVNQFFYIHFDAMGILHKLSLNVSR